MKYNTSNIIGDAGEHLVAARIIKLFECPCRLVNIDIGIDAEIEIIDSNKKSTGQFIKAQIKTTISDKMYLYIDGKHISYWNKIGIPVVIFLVHIDAEKIYWHCVEDLDSYELLDSGYKIEFAASNILQKNNKQKFLEISLFPLEREIKRRYEECYKLAKEDKELYLDTGDYDLVTYEEFVFHSNKIKFHFDKIERIFRKYDGLRKLEVQYHKKLELINDYLDEIEEGKESILLDTDSDYFDHLDSKNWDWD